MNILFLDTFFIQFVIKLAIIFAGYFLIRNVIVPFIRSDKWKKRITYYLSPIRNVALFLLILEVLITLGAVNPIVTAIITAGMTALLWGYLKEVFYGTVFRFHRGQIIGQSLKVKAYKGVVIGLHNTKVQLANEKGETFSLPYSLIIQSVEEKPSISKNLKTCTLEATISDEKFKQYKAELSEMLYKTPYLVMHSELKFDVIQQDAQTITCKTVVYTNHDKFIPGIKKKYFSWLEQKAF